MCKDGQCLDPCKDIDCPPPMECRNAVCQVPCACYEGDAGCVDVLGTVCDTTSGECVPPSCVGVECEEDQTCDPTTGTCVDFCNDDVVCPQGQKCLWPDGCVPVCTDVPCEGGLECNPNTGECEDLGCVDLTCFPPQVCEYGECVDSGTGGAGGGGAGGSAAAGGTGASNGAAADPEDDGGCGCVTVGRSPVGSAVLGWLVFAGVAIGRLRRRRP